MPARSLPADARRSLRLYRLLFPVVFLFLLPGYVLRLLRRGHYRAHFGQRLGFYSAAERAVLGEHRWTWIQSISVGETLLALKLAQALRASEPEIHIVISTTTTTGFALAQEHAAAWLRPVYNPIDLPFPVRRTMAVLRPERLLVIEGGIWPNLLVACSTAGLPVLLINARLSPRSARRFQRFRGWVGPLFRLFDRITLPEASEAERWTALGVDADRLSVTGSIKFDQPATSDSGREAEFRALLEGIGILPFAPILVAGSTFPGEEKILAEALLALRRTHPELVLILVPRHIERTPAILRELAELPITLARRTQLAIAPPRPHVLLVDTTGELRDWYRLATVTFIGKSLTATGGQNPAEPAVLGKPVLFGPHMENFASLAQHLLATGAARQITGLRDLTTTLDELLTHPAARRAMSAAAAQALLSHRGAAKRNAELIFNDVS